MLTQEQTTLVQQMIDAVGQVRAAALENDLKKSREAKSVFHGLLKKFDATTGKTDMTHEKSDYAWLLDNAVNAYETSFSLRSALKTKDANEVADKIEKAIEEGNNLLAQAKAKLEEEKEKTAQ